MNTPVSAAIARCRAPADGRPREPSTRTWAGAATRHLARRIGLGYRGLRTRRYERSSAVLTTASYLIDVGTVSILASVLAQAVGQLTYGPAS
jgi:hypothetical protein